MDSESLQFKHQRQHFDPFLAPFLILALLHKIKVIIWLKWPDFNHVFSHVPDLLQMFAAILKPEELCDFNHVSHWTEF